MNKSLKTLLLVSTIVLPLSACSGHLHGKNDDGYYHKMHCKHSKNLDRAKSSAENTLRELDRAVANTSDEATRQRLQKIVKNADKLSEEISQCQRMCEAKMHGDSTSGKKEKHKKVNHSAKPAAAPQAAAPAPAPAKH